MEASKTKSFRLNRKGQFSIIAAMLVAVILVSAVITTYSSIRYTSDSETPQTLSTIDEVNLALKRILGFTVGYYGSVLQVTGNTTYAKALASNYLGSGLDNIADIRPDLSPSFKIVNLDLKTNWYSNYSYSSGDFTIEYDLGGLGVSGLTYSTSTQLDVQVLSSPNVNQALLNVSSDGEPLVNLGKSSFKFYKYIFSNASWGLIGLINEPTTYMDGRYLVDLPNGMNSSFVIQIEDTRGLMVVASSFSQFKGTLAWNTTSVEEGFDFVDYANLNVTGTHSDFTAQQSIPDSVYDTLTEGASGYSSNNYYASYRNLFGSTTVSQTSGNLTADTCSNDGNYLQLRSYPTAYGSSSLFGLSTKGSSSTPLSNIKGTRFTSTTNCVANSISAYLKFTPSNGNLGNTNTGTSGQSIVNTIRGQRFTAASSGIAQSVSAYLDVTSATLGYTSTQTSYDSIENYIRGSSFTASITGAIDSISAYIYCNNRAKDMKAAIYTDGSTNTLVSQSSAVTVPTGTAWVVFPFSTKPNLTAGTTYILVVWSESDNGNANLYYHYSSQSNQGHYRSYNYNDYSGNYPSPGSLSHDSTKEYCIYANYTPQSRNVKAAIYTDSPYTLVASSSDTAVSADGWVTFTLTTNPTLTAGTNYVLVVWSQSGNGDTNLCYSASTGGNGRYVSQTYGSWPSTLSLTTNSYQSCIYCSYTTTFKAKAAVYSGTGGALLGTTEEKTLGATDGFVTFNFDTEPNLVASTNYVLCIWSSDSNVLVYYNSGTYERFESSGSYPTWPSTVADQYSTRAYSIYCTYSQVTQYTAQLELIGTSDLLSWQQLTWTVDSSVSVGTASLTLQLATSAGTYPTSGDGYDTTVLSTSDSARVSTITSAPTNFRNSTGYWKILLTAVGTSSQFDLKIDLAQFAAQFNNYALNLQEQFLSINASFPRQDLCIKAGTLGSESLMVQVLHDSSWQNLKTLTTGWNNISVSSYIDSSDLTIRFIGTTETGDPTQNTYQIDAVFLKPQPDIDYLINLQDSTFTVEYLQNGTLRWLGQNLQLTTQELPIPPIPVKAIHVNATLNGVNQEIPFQIEDWSSNYQVPLGLTSNASVFSSNQMLVFLLNNEVTDFTVWWDGSDNAVQTSLAYTNKYFTGDNPTVTPSKGVLTNGILGLTVEIVSSVFKVTSTAGSTSSTTTFMRVNEEDSTYGAGQAFVIHHGIVRDIVAQEAEWGGGATDSPNVYASIVLTLPANVSYYTYSLRMIYIESTQPRTLTDLCPLQLSTTLSSVQAQTENDTIARFPIVQNGTGTFSNYTSGGWTAHHWSQLITNNGQQGTGIMFTDNANLKLYTFDSIAGASTGSISANNSTKIIELLPVDLASASFQYPLDITWSGAVATFSGTTPICKMYESTTPTGLWILAECPPTLTIVAQTS